VTKVRPRITVRLNRVVPNVKSSSVEVVCQFSRELHLCRLAMYPTQFQGGVLAVKESATDGERGGLRMPVSRGSHKAASLIGTRCSSDPCSLQGRNNVCDGKGALNLLTRRH
jgi:hypothetical protein